MKHFLFVACFVGCAALAITGCEAPVDCSTAELEFDFETGSPCFADYERDAALNVTHTSSMDAALSHNVGMNCSGCHQENGPGLGLFTASGTVYMADGNVAAPGSLVGIYADADRTVPIAELEVDQHGNVYTTDDLGLSGAKRFVSVWSADGELRADMGSPKLNLSCNFCHDASYRIELDPATDSVN
ncbi:MAG: hypothetical protein KDA24_27040 [Deltaproteobacteria bacterium]|nr:hypothetical protein [Deltaproteobacteria bacterium]